MSYFSDRIRGMWKAVGILTDVTGANVADVDATGAVKVTGTFSPGAPATLTASAPTVAAVGVASAQVVAANASRAGLILINRSTSGQVISLGFDGNAAVAGSGATLAVGDAYNMGALDFTVGAVTAIASGASASLAIQEYT